MTLAPGAVSAAFVLIADLAVAKGCPMPITLHPGVYELEIDSHWRCWINGHKDPQPLDGIMLAPYSAALEFNGWPAGVIGVHGGPMAAGEAANEDTLIEALKRAIVAAGGKVEELDYV